VVYKVKQCTFDPNSQCWFRVVIESQALKLLALFIKYLLFITKFLSNSVQSKNIEKLWGLHCIFYLVKVWQYVKSCKVKRRKRKYNDSSSVLNYYKIVNQFYRGFITLMALDIWGYVPNLLLWIKTWTSRVMFSLHKLYRSKIFNFNHFCYFHSIILCPNLDLNWRPLVCRTSVTDLSRREQKNLSWIPWKIYFVQKVEFALLSRDLSYYLLVSRIR
jgi:hypothetical protein